jgi:hypothetical protein
MGRGEFTSGEEEGPARALEGEYPTPEIFWSPVMVPVKA